MPQYREWLVTESTENKWTVLIIDDLPLCVFQAQLEAQKATQDFQRATEVLRAAKETISLAEQRLLEEDNRQFDSAWQEMLNHATQRVRKRGRGSRHQRQKNIILVFCWIF